MKYLVNVFLFVALGTLLTISGIPCNTWQYWACFACVIGLNINAILW